MVKRLRRKIYSTSELGALGEMHACRYLRKNGCKILERNWRNRLGEIDIIAREGRELVFVEVKTRLAAEGGGMYLFDSIDSKKRRTLRMLAQCYIDRHFPGRMQPPFRIDVIGVLLSKSNYSALTLDHILRAI